MSTFARIYIDLLNLGSQPSSDGDAKTMCKQAINRTYRRIGSLTGQDTRRREFTFTSVASTSKFGLPLYVREILNIEESTNTRRLIPITPSQYDERYVASTQTGDPTHYYNFGDFGVQRQPASALTLVFSSSNANDTGKLRVTGLNGSTVLVSELVTLSGTSNVTTTNSYNPAMRIVKQTATLSNINGNITVTDGSNTLAVIPFWVNAPTYQWIEFFPIPDSAITYTVRALSYLPDLVNDEDWPEIDEDYHDLLLYGAGMEVLPSFGKADVAALFKRMYDEMLKRYLGEVANDQPNVIKVFHEVQLGSILPARPLIPGVDFLAS